MVNFSMSTKNIHRELKDTLDKTEMLMTQYIKVKGPDRTVQQESFAGNDGVVVQTQIQKALIEFRRRRKYSLKNSKFS